jgi:hypothetical protein
MRGSLNESRVNAVALQDSLVPGGLVFSVEPNRVSVGASCVDVTIVGWHLGDGSDITSVSLNGVSSSDIVSQSKHHVTVTVTLTGAAVGTGHVVVTSDGFTTTLVDGFTFDAAASVVIVEDFETKLDVFYQADESVHQLSHNVRGCVRSLRTCQRRWYVCSGEGGCQWTRRRI